MEQGTCRASFGGRMPEGSTLLFCAGHVGLLGMTLSMFLENCMWQ